MAASLKDQLAAAKVRIAELEAELADAEQALTGAAPTPVVDGPAAGTAVWLMDSGGKPWNVEVGSTPYEMLFASGAQECDPPSGE